MKKYISQRRNKTQKFNKKIEEAPINSIQESSIAAICEKIKHVGKNVTLS
jgi:hypothetical protein